MVKVVSGSRSSHGQGCLKVTVILWSRSFWNQMVMCFDFYPEAGGWLSSACFLVLDVLAFRSVVHQLNKLALDGMS